MLGVSYNVFDGIELLEYSINQIRENVDFINIVYQNISYFGHKIKQKNEEKLFSLKEKKLIDNLELFKVENICNTAIEAKDLEKEKRNRGRKICIENGCDYFLDLDVDELFDKEQFLKAKNFIIDNKIQYSICETVNYCYLPTIQKITQKTQYIMFVCKIDWTKSLGSTNYSKSIDPTRGYIIENFGKVYEFKKEDLIMHHMSNVRKDLFLKYKASSVANLDKTRINELIHCIKNLNIDEENSWGFNDFCLTQKNNITEKFIKVENKFNISEEIFLDE